MATAETNTHAQDASIQAEGNITADWFDDSDYDSATDASETFSLASSINQYVMENGRRYHVYWGPDKNPMPNDDMEQHRLDLVHEATLLICGNRIHFAPIGNQVQRALDLGTGTGAWAIEFAQENPHTEVIGIDISPTMPSWVPPNCRLEVDDFEAEWNYRAQFDFIHARTIMQSVSNWPRLLAQAKKYLHAGRGWLELSEYYIMPECDDNTIPDDWPPVRLCNLLKEGLERAGRECPRGHELADMLRDAGFVDVQVKTLKLPIGNWPKNPVLKQAGAMMTHILETGYEAYSMQILTKVLGMSDEETKSLCAAAKAANHAPGARKIHAYAYYYVAYGRKPDSV